MLSSRGCACGVFMRHTFIMVLGASVGRCLLRVGQAMEWHKHCRQPLQGQSQQQHYCYQFASKFTHIYSAYQTLTQQAILKRQTIDKAVQEKFCMSIVITGILVTVDLTYGACT